MNKDLGIADFGFNPKSAFRLRHQLMLRVKYFEPAGELSPEA